MSNDLHKFKELLVEYILEAGKDMLHAPASNLPYPFVVPGAGYNHDLWDWDCFFAVMALLQILEEKERRGELTEEERNLVIAHAKGNVLNFLNVQMEDGYIPIVLVADADVGSMVLHRNGCITNMHKPCLAMNVVLISGYAKDFSWIEKDFYKVEKYIQCYENYYKDKSGLFVWANDVMIGVDNDPATFGRPPKSSANIYLNSMMVRELKSIAYIAEMLGNEEKKLLYLEKAGALEKCIQEECWDRRDELFYSVDVDCSTRRPNPKVSGFHMGLGVTWNTIPVKIQCWSSFLPMWANIANAQQAQSMLEKHILNPNTFNSSFGIRSLSRDEKMYSVSATSNPSNWLGPIWIVANYIVFQSLLHYNYLEEARVLGEKIVTLLGKDLEKNGALHEYYVPETGEGVMNKGFLNWNLLALNIICEMDGIKTVERFLPF